MIDSEYSTDYYKSSKLNIGEIIKDPEMVRLVPDYLITKKMWLNMELKCYRSL